MAERAKEPELSAGPEALPGGSAAQPAWTEEQQAWAAEQAAPYGGGHGGGNERWLVSYADFITLLMVFFVILYSMANVDKNKFQQVAHSLSSAFGGGGRTLIVVDGGTGRNGSNFIDPTTLAGTIATPSEEINKGDHSGDDPDPLAHMGQIIGPELAKATQNQVHIYQSVKGLTISLQGSALFDSGKATIKPDAKQALKIIADQLKKTEYFVSVEGSADNRPINTAQFPSNWELSSARATNVMRYLIDNFGLSAHRFTSTSYGEYHPIADNGTEEGRQMNRRVDIVLLAQPPRVDLGTEIKIVKP